LTELFLNNIYLALLLPLWIFLIIMVGRFFSVYVNKVIIYILSLVSSGFGALFCGLALLKFPVDKVLETSYPFIRINHFTIDCGLFIDRTSLIFASILFIVSFLVILFSISYTKNEKKNYRFYALINLFNFSMGSLFFSANLFQTYFFWEIAGVISYLLIGFEYDKLTKSLASKKVFIINRIGDTAFLGAIIVSSYLIYSYAPNKALATLSLMDLNAISTLVYAYTTTPWFEVVCTMFILGAIVKSAQFPFFTWLQDAMEAKLPVSALLHSSTLVAAGIYLTYRLLPFYELEPLLLKVISIIGILTAFICSISACAESHPKKVLAYSTSAQLGLIFYALGTLNIKAAISYFIAHAFIKATLFLTLPKDCEEWNFSKFILFLISGLSLSGLILSGMIAKEMISSNTGLSGTIIISILSFLTAFYIIRIALVLFNKNNIRKSIPNILECVSLLGLLGLNIIFYIYLHKVAQYKIAEPFWAALTAWIVVYILYIKNAFWKVPILYPLAINGFYLDRFYSNFLVCAYSKLTKVCNTVDTKVFGNYSILIFLSKSIVKFFSFIEENIMNGFIRFIVRTFKKLSVVYKKLQTGNLENYNTYAFIIITITIVSILISYLIIMYLGYIKGVIG